MHFCRDTFGLSLGDISLKPSHYLKIISFIYIFDDRLRNSPHLIIYSILNKKREKMATESIYKGTAGIQQQTDLFSRSSVTTIFRKRTLFLLSFAMAYVFIDSKNKYIKL